MKKYIWLRVHEKPPRRAKLIDWDDFYSYTESDGQMRFERKYLYEYYEKDKIQ